VDLRAGLDDFGEEKILDPTGTRTPTPGSSSPSIDRLRYPGSLRSCVKVEMFIGVGVSGFEVLVN
jgi:hypothetical protein